MSILTSPFVCIRSRALFPSLPCNTKYDLLPKISSLHLQLRTASSDISVWILPTRLSRHWPILFSTRKRYNFRLNIAFTYFSSLTNIVLWRGSGVIPVWILPSRLSRIFVNSVGKPYRSSTLTFLSSSTIIAQWCDCRGIPCLEVPVISSSFRPTVIFSAKTWASLM